MTARSIDVWRRVRLTVLPTWLFVAHHFRRARCSWRNPPKTGGLRYRDLALMGGMPLGLALVMVALVYAHVPGGQTVFLLVLCAGAVATIRVMARGANTLTQEVQATLNDPLFQHAMSHRRHALRARRDAEAMESALPPATARAVNKSPRL